MIKFKLSILGVLLFVIYYSPITATAQTAPEFMVTWKANDYVPAEYQGKILPIDKTAININFEIIENGKLADLSKTEVFWHINNVFQKSGPGLKNSTFLTDRTRGDQLVEIIIQNYKSAQGTIKLENSLTIPLFKPEAIIDTSYPDNEVAAGTNNFRALLYFFNIINPLTDVSYTWSTNDQNAAGEAANPSLLTLDTAKLPIGTDFNLTLRAQSLLSDIELSKQLINLKIK